MAVTVFPLYSLQGLWRGLTVCNNINKDKGLLFLKAPTTLTEYTDSTTLYAEKHRQIIISSWLFVVSFPGAVAHIPDSSVIWRLKVRL